MALTQPRHPQRPSSNPPASLIHNKPPSFPISWFALPLGHWLGLEVPCWGHAMGRLCLPRITHRRSVIAPQGGQGCSKPGAECRHGSAPASPHRCTRKAGKGPPMKEKSRVQARSRDNLALPLSNGSLHPLKPTARVCPPKEAGQKTRTGKAPQAIKCYRKR